MRKFYFVLLLVSFFIPSISSAQIRYYNGTMSNADYLDLYTRDPYSKVYLPCDFEYSGTHWADANIRFKGSTTRYFNKKSFKLKFSSGNLFQTQKDMVLQANYTDKSFMNNKLCFDLFNALNVISPIAPYFISFRLNSFYKGLYLQIEDVGNKYFFTNHSRAIGPVYEANADYSMADLTIQPISTLKLYYEKQVGDTNYYTDLYDMIVTLNNTPESTFPTVINQLFDMNTVYTWLAMNAAVADGDTYTSNYYLYRDTTRTTAIWSIIPWDYDMTMGRDGDPNKPYPYDMLNDGFSYNYDVLSGPDNKLKDRVWANATTKEQFRLRLKYILDNYFIESYMWPKIDQLANQNAAEVNIDPLKWGTIEDYWEHVAARKYFVTARRNFLYKTYINSPSGQYDYATIHPTQTNVPYYFVDHDGTLLATMTFANYSGLDSIRVTQFPNTTPPNIPNAAAQKYVKKYYQITPYPATGQYNAKIEFMYLDYFQTETEVMSGVQNERLLKAAYYNTSNVWTLFPSTTNAFANTVTIQSITQAVNNRNIAFYVPDSYPQSWFRFGNLDWQRFYDVKFTSTANGFITGEQGRFMKTVNGGANWTGIDMGTNLTTYKMYINGSTIITSAEFGQIFKSVNGGTNWTRISTSTTQPLYALYFSSVTEGWAVGGGGVVLHTVNGGTNWTSTVVDANCTFKSIDGFSNTEILISGTGGKVYKTTNGGTNWVLKSIGTANDINVIKKYGTTSMGLAGKSGTIMYSTNKGDTWAAINNYTYEYTDIFYIDDTHIYVCGADGRIYYTQNRGTNWFYQYTADEHALNGIYFTDATHGFSVGNGGTILRTTTAGTISVGNTSLTLPLEYKVYQNYPNPFNPVTKITYDIMKSGNVKLIVFDVLGREISTLVNQQQTAGSYSVEFNGVNLSTGIYFYRLEVNGYVEVKKMMFMK
jgi:photosystem II stability/assembly factor-like uncharacterized protein